MRNRLLAIAAIAGAISAPIAAQAQNEITTGVARGGRWSSTTTKASPSISGRRSANTSFASGCRITSIPDRVVVGGVLPETGVTYYDVPQTFGVTPYRYTVVNGRDRAGRTALTPHRSGGRVDASTCA